MSETADKTALRASVMIALCVSEDLSRWGVKKVCRLQDGTMDTEVHEFDNPVAAALDLFKCAEGLRDKMLLTVAERVKFVPPEKK